jgi:glycerophosphoryl diester phosphodiesterase
MLRTRPHFLAFDVAGLPSPASRLFRAAGLPVICWTVRDEATRSRALRWCDQITFEGFLPDGPE